MIPPTCWVGQPSIWNCAFTIKAICMIAEQLLTFALANHAYNRVQFLIRDNFSFLRRFVWDWWRLHEHSRLKGINLTGGTMWESIWDATNLKAQFWIWVFVKLSIVRLKSTQWMCHKNRPKISPWADGVEIEIGKSAKKYLPLRCSQTLQVKLKLTQN